MTSEMGEDFNAWRAARSANREARMRHNLSKLSEAGVAYETPHALHHAVIKAGRRTIDYWPTTDKLRDKSVCNKISVLVLQAPSCNALRAWLTHARRFAANQA